MNHHQIAMTEVRMHRSPQHGFLFTLCYDRPIDAPETLPAGSVSNTVYVDWRGNGVPMPTECERS